MRVSLAAALALPLQTDAGAAFPGRDLILFLTFAVILVTLVGQGLTLPVRDSRCWVSRTTESRIARTRRRASARPRRRSPGSRSCRAEDWVREDTAERMRGLYRFRSDRFRARLDDGDDGAIEARSQDYQRLRRELLEAERQALHRAAPQRRDQNDVWIRVGRDLDLEDQRLDI